MTPSLARPSSTGVILVTERLYWHKSNIYSLSRLLNTFFSIDDLSIFIFLVTFLDCSKKHQPSRDHQRGYRGSWAETQNWDLIADRGLEEGVGGFVDAFWFLSLAVFVFLSYSFNLLAEILFLDMYHSLILAFPWISSKFNTANSTWRLTQIDAQSPVVWVHVLWCLTPAPLKLYGERETRMAGRTNTSTSLAPRMGQATTMQHRLDFLFTCESSYKFACQKRSNL